MLPTLLPEKDTEPVYTQRAKDIWADETQTHRVKVHDDIKVGTASHKNIFIFIQTFAVQ